MLFFIFSFMNISKKGTRKECLFKAGLFKQHVIMAFLDNKISCCVCINQSTTLTIRFYRHCGRELKGKLCTNVAKELIIFKNKTSLC